MSMLIILSIGSFSTSCMKERNLKEEICEPSANNKLKSATTTNYHFQWGDEFNYNGTPDPSKWKTNTWWTYRFRYLNVYAGPGANNPADCWSFNDGDWNLANCVTLLDQSLNTDIVDGNYLRIKSRHDILAPNSHVCDFSTGYIESISPFKYGYFEIKAHIPKGDCIGSSFWLTGTEELDIFESYGWNTNIFPTNLHKTSYPSSPSDINMSYDLANGFHTYGFSWGNGLATWYIDNKIVRSVNDINKVGNTDCNIVLSINLPDARASVVPMINNTKSQNLPFEDFIIDYMRVYDKRPTTAMFSTLDNSGNLTTLSDFTDWSLNWDIIIPGDFNGDTYKDLMLYSKTEGKVLFLSCDGNGNVNTIREINGWRGTWDQIISGSFGGTELTDLFLYDKSTGEGMFYSYDGSFSSSSTFPTGKTTWKIVSGNFNGIGTDDLMFYDKSSGAVNFYQTLTSNNLQIFKQITGWRTTWDQIIPGNFGESELTDLLLYDKSASVGESMFYSLDGTFSSSSTFSTGKSTWKIISGNFNNANSKDEILLYDTNNNGQANLYSINVTPGISLYKSYTDWNPSWDIIVPGQFNGTGNIDLIFYDK